jgi:DNA-binding LacI/PurR family transcriptional regulator
MYELEQNVFDGSRVVIETLRVSQYDLILFNIDTQSQRIEYLHKFVHSGMADGFLVITLPVQDNEFDPFHQVNILLVLEEEAHPLMLHVAFDDVHGVYLIT